MGLAGRLVVCCTERWEVLEERDGDKGLAALVSVAVV